MPSQIVLLSRLRLYGFRVLLFCSLVNIIETIYALASETSRSEVVSYTLHWVPLLVCIACHHVVVTTGWKYLYVWLDALLLCAELGGLFHNTVYDYYGSWFSDLPIAIAPTLFVLSLFAVNRAATMLRGLRKGWKSLFEPFRFFSEEERSSLGTPWSIILGRRLLSPYLLGESSWVIIFRSVLAYSCLCLLIGYAYFILFIRPFLSNQVWTRQVTITKLEDWLVGRHNLSLIVYLPSEACTDETSVNANVSVTPPFLFSYPHETQCPILEHRRCAFACPFLSSQTVPEIFGDSHTVWEIPPSASFPKYIPDIMIDFNFSAFHRRDGYVGVSFRDQEADQTYTRPIRLSRSKKETVAIGIEFRETLSEHAGSYWRLIKQPVYRFPVITELSRSLDVDLNASEQRHDHGSLRLTVTPQRVWTLYQDTRKFPFIDGIASVGGFWTILNGAFAFFCGHGLMEILMGRKPLSLSGKVHLFCRRRIREANMRAYPQMREDRQAGGLSSLIMDYFVDSQILQLGDRDNEDVSCATGPMEEASHPTPSSTLYST